MSFLIRAIQLAAAVVVLVAAWFAVYRPAVFQSYFPQPRMEAPAPDRSFSRVEAQVLDTVQSSHDVLRDANAAIEALTRQLAATNEKLQDLVAAAGVPEDKGNAALAVADENDGLIAAAAEVQKAVKAAALAAASQADVALRTSGTDEEAAVAALMAGQANGEAGEAGETRMAPRWGIVFGAELTQPAAERLLERATEGRPNLVARLYRRNGFIRGVMQYPTHAAAMQDLASLRDRVNADAYVVSLDRWCVGGQEVEGVIQCGP
jgi:ABC-type transporter Mla subunit MlaD